MVNDRRCDVEKHLEADLANHLADFAKVGAL